MTLKKVLTERILFVLQFNDNKWRALSFDETSREVLLLLTENRLIDLNLFLEDQSVPNSVSVCANGKGNFQLHDFLFGIYPYQDHCFHLNGHGDPTLSLTELCRMLKLNPDCSELTTE